MQKQLDGVALHALFTDGYRNLKKNMTAVNDLNVFPVPDGDTGTNMVLTFGGGLQATPADIPHIGDYMKRLAQAVLLSARGNSGVIFSQFIHGLARGFADKATVTFGDFAHAFDCAVEDAYGAIITPTEGTILTLIREAAEFLDENADTYPDIESGTAAIVEQMKRSLANTPNLLPVLKAAGVVDSGGAGLLCFVEGIYAHLCGQVIEDTPGVVDDLPTALPPAGDFGPDSVLEYGYCTEFILQLMTAKTDLAAFDLAPLTAALEEIGDSIVAVQNDGIVKIHVHTFTPEKALAIGREYGEFLTVKIENMSVQHSEVAAQPPAEKQPYAIVAVASGEGIKDYFTSIGATVVIDGGQTSNPSVNAFLDAFRSVNAEHILVLPNNSNILFTAEQAAKLYDKAPVHVLPTRSIVEGYSALSLMNPWCDSVEELLDDMTGGLKTPPPPMSPPPSATPSWTARRSPRGTISGSTTKHSSPKEPHGKRPRWNSSKKSPTPPRRRSSLSFTDKMSLPRRSHRSKRLCKTPTRSQTSASSTASRRYTTILFRLNKGVVNI